MGKMTDEEIKTIYEMAKAIYEGKRDKNTCKEIVYEKYGTNQRSFVNWFVPLFSYMMKGTTFKGSVPLCLSEYYLKSILRDFGTDFLQNALKSYKGTIDYYQNDKGVNKPGCNLIYEHYLMILNKEKSKDSERFHVTKEPDK